jgi:glycolate oxidase
MEAGAEMVARARLICGERHVIASPTGSASEVSGIVAACAATGTAYVVRGAGTSRTGDALPIADGVLIVLSRMRRVLTISSTRRELTVEAGAPPALLERALPGRWFEQPDPIGTVGGLLAGTPGVANVAALDLVQTTGRFVHLDARDPGYDLTGAFAGSRGRAGIAVTITLRMLPEP